MKNPIGDPRFRIRRQLYTTIRGGGWSSYPDGVHLLERNIDRPSVRGRYSGFRIVRNVS